MPFALPRAATRLFTLVSALALSACAEHAEPPPPPANVAEALPADTLAAGRLAADPALADAAPAPDFTLPGPAGPFALAEHRGRVVVLTFWATWSELGVAQLETLGALHAELAAQDVVVVGVAQDEQGLRALVPFAAAHPLPFAVVADSLQAVAGRYGRVEMLPTTVLVDREGLVRAQHVGVLDRAGLLALLAPVLVEGDERPTWQPTSLAGQPGEVARLPAAEAHALVASGAMLVDVRPAQVRTAEGTVQHAASLPLDTLKPTDLPANVGVPLVFLGSATDAARAAELALGWGYASVGLVEGGLAGWRAAGLPVEQPAPTDEPLPPRDTDAVLG